MRSKFGLTFWDQSATFLAYEHHTKFQNVGIHDTGRKFKKKIEYECT